MTAHSQRNLSANTLDSICSESSLDENMEFRSRQSTIRKGRKKNGDLSSQSNSALSYSAMKADLDKSDSQRRLALRQNRSKTQANGNKRQNKKVNLSPSGKALNPTASEAKLKRDAILAKLT